jgi:hypothetical protein
VVHWNAAFAEVMLHQRRVAVVHRGEQLHWAFWLV